MITVAWLVLGLIAGLVASLIVRSRGYGAVGDIVFVSLGVLFVGWLGSMLMWLDATGLNLTSIAFAVAGAVAAIAIDRTLSSSWRSAE